MFGDLRGFLAACKAAGDLREIRGAHWDLEIGALVEAAAELINQPPVIVFDGIPGYPSGYRVASLLYGSYRRGALVLGLSPEMGKLELMRQAARKVREAKPIAPVEVPTGPVTENVRQGSAVDMFTFPVPRYHQNDGGRYIGTGDLIIMRSSDGNWVNMATYRVQVHEPGVLGLWISPGQQGQQICQGYWAEGRSCPVVAVFGCDPLTLLAARMRLPYGRSELELAGGLRGQPLEVVRGPVTGLPIPAHAEIAIEGEVPPLSEEARDEGPFGEWQGYYSGGSLGTGKPQPVIRVKALYYRNEPILVDEAPLWFGAPREDLRLAAGLLWEQLEAAGIQDVVGVCQFTNYFDVVAIRQRYAGHARQAGHAVLSCSATATDGRYVVVVDEDIDPTNLKEVLWAMTTRVDPATDIEVVDGCRGTPLDPRMAPEKRRAGDFSSARVIIYAVRPFSWRSEFPKTSRSERSLRQKMIERYKNVLPFKG